MLDTIDVADYGAVGDGIADDTEAVQAALNAAEAAGQPICTVPAGKYRIGGALVVPPGVTLCGASGGVPHSEHPIGTVLLAYGGRGDAEGDPLITLKPNAVVRNLTLHYPEQSVPDVVPYPWSIRADGELCQITDVTLTNPYQGLDLGTCWNELHTVRNVFACPLNTGVFIDRCTDIGRLENVHFNPNFWTRMAPELGSCPNTAAIKPYLEQNLIGFKIGKTDWEYITNSFVIFPKIGFHFDDFGARPGQRGDHTIRQRYLSGGRSGRSGPVARGCSVCERAVHGDDRGCSGQRRPREVRQLRVLGDRGDGFARRQTRPQYPDSERVSLHPMGCR